GVQNEGSYPYPSAAEIPAIRAGFDHFFQTIDHKETDKGVALFSLSSDDRAFVRGDERYVPIGRDEILGVVAAFARNVKALDITDVIVVERAQDLPDAI